MTAVGREHAQLVLKQTTFETSQTGHPGNRICQVVASQNFVSEDPGPYCDTALITKWLSVWGSPYGDDER